MNKDQRYLRQKAGLHHGIVHLKPGDVTSSFAPMIATLLWFAIAFVVVATLRWKRTTKLRGAKIALLVGPSVYLLLALSFSVFIGTDPMFLVNWKVVLLWTIVGTPVAIGSGFILVTGLGYLDDWIKARRKKTA